MLSTTHKPLGHMISGEEMDTKGQTVIRKRKRPKETSSAARTARKPFGNSPIKNLRIPTVYNDYNHNMGGVDIADQLREGMSGLRRIRRGGWRALWHFILNLTLVNSFLLSGFKSQFEFRNALIRQLLEKGSVGGVGATGKGAQAQRRKVSALIGESRTRSNLERQHQGHKLGYRGIQQYCIQCNTVPERRPVLREVSSNLSGRKVIGKSKGYQRRKKSRYGCTICNIALCKEGNCFNLHVNSF
jgi:hypothetical protein